MCELMSMSKWMVQDGKVTLKWRDFEWIRATIWRAMEMRALFVLRDASARVGNVETRGVTVKCDVGDWEWSSPSCLPSHPLLTLSPLPIFPLSILSLILLSLFLSSLSASFCPLSLHFLFRLSFQIPFYLFSLFLSSFFLSVFLFTTPSFITPKQEWENRRKWRRKEEQWGL